MFGETPSCKQHAKQKTRLAYKANCGTETNPKPEPRQTLHVTAHTGNRRAQPPSPAAGPCLRRDHSGGRPRPGCAAVAAAAHSVHRRRHRSIGQRVRGRGTSSEARSASRGPQDGRARGRPCSACALRGGCAGAAIPMQNTNYTCETGPQQAARRARIASAPGTRRATARCHASAGSAMGPPGG